MPGWCWLPLQEARQHPCWVRTGRRQWAPGKRDGGPNVVIRGGETIMPVLLIPRVRVKSDPSEHAEYIAKLSICLRSLEWGPQTGAGYERRSESRG